MNASTVGNWTDKLTETCKLDKSVGFAVLLLFIIFSLSLILSLCSLILFLFLSPVLYPYLSFFLPFLLFTSLHAFPGIMVNNWIQTNLMTYIHFSKRSFGCIHLSGALNSNYVAIFIVTIKCIRTSVDYKYNSKIAHSGSKTN